jgi:hypothetical protein
MPTIPKEIVYVMNREIMHVSTATSSKASGGQLSNHQQVDTLGEWI